MRSARDRKLFLVKVCLIVCGLLAWAGAALAADAGALPAGDWNRSNLERIKVPAGNALTFAVLGDYRSNPAVFEAVLKRLDQEPGLAFAIDVGDLVESGSLESFGDFLSRVRRRLRLPLLTVIGNHDLDRERNSAVYRGIFGPDHYAFQIKDNYFIMIDDVEPGGESEWAWLEAELKKSQAYQTRLVFLHIPLFDPREGQKPHALPEAAGARLLELFARYGVTRVFAGHIHGYFDGTWDGVPYTITAGAGAPLYGTDPEHYFYHYLIVTLEEGKVRIQVRRISAEGRP